MSRQNWHFGEVQAWRYAKSSGALSFFIERRLSTAD
jgi:hypothetical protein